MAWLRRIASCLAATFVLVAPIGPAHSAPQPSVASTRAAYDLAQQRVAALTTRSAHLAASADQAAAEAERLRESVSDDGGFLSAVSNLLGGTSDLDRATEAADNATFTRELADRAAADLAAAITARDSARVAWARAERQQRKAEEAWTADEAADAAIERAQFAASYAVTDAAQDQRNQRAQQVWQRQLRAVARNAVVPPTISELAEPAAIRSPLEPVRDVKNRLSPGVAEIDPPGRRPVTVLPAETVRAVSEALHLVGVTAGVDPTTYRCSGLVAQAWSALSLPTDAVGLWDQLLTVPTPSVEPGDVVLLGDRSTGIDGTGVYVGRGQVVVADADTGVPAVQPMGDAVIGVRRPGFDGRHAAAPGGGRCGIAAPTGTGGPLDLPMLPDSYVITTGFGEAGPLWSSGEHTGLDFAALTGTAVFAAAAGTVTIEHPDWAGNLVRIDHGGGVETLYAHLSAVSVEDGQTIEAGDPVGLVGDLGNTTGPHLHFEVRLDGTPYDPASVLWGGTALCPAITGGTTQLPCDVAVALRLGGR